MRRYLPQRELEKEVARANPGEAVAEKTKVLNARDAFISLSISIEAKEQLERLKDLLSQKTGKPASLRDVVEYFAKETVNRLDPVKKAERNAACPSPRPRRETHSRKSNYPLFGPPSA